MLLSQPHLPLAAALLAGGTLLAAVSGEALAPHRGGHPVTSCRPRYVEPVAPALGVAQLRLAGYVSRRYLVGFEAAEWVVQAAYEAGGEVGLDPLLVLAVAAVESSFNPLAQSAMGAKGLMQIIPKYHREKLGGAADDGLLFDPEANLRLGARILQEYVYRTGTMEAGLQFYNGAFWDPTAQYARKVMAERLRFEAVLRGAGETRTATLSADAS